MAALDDFKPSWVVNFAAQGMVAQSWIHPEHWYRTNVLGNVLFHDQLRTRSWLEKYVHVGTPEVYGSTQGLIDERAPFNPSTPYAASRAACDLHLRTFFWQYKFPVTWLSSRLKRLWPWPAVVPHHPAHHPVIKLGQKLQLHGGGHSIRSFIHIDDVAVATLAVAQQAPGGECFHLSTSRFVSIRELVEMICREMGADFNQVAEVSADRPGKDAAYQLDCEKARQQLAWRDTVDLESGIRATLAWVDKHFDELKRQPLDYQHKP